MESKANKPAMTRGVFPVCRTPENKFLKSRFPMCRAAIFFLINNNFDKNKLAARRRLIWKDGNSIFAGRKIRSDGIQRWAGFCGRMKTTTWTAIARYALSSPGHRCASWPCGSCAWHPAQACCTSPCLRYCSGGVPNFSLNTRLKWVALSNPLSYEISLTLFCEVISKS